MKNEKRKMKTGQQNKTKSVVSVPTFVHVMLNNTHIQTHTHTHRQTLMAASLSPKEKRQRHLTSAVELNKAQRLALHSNGHRCFLNDGSCCVCGGVPQWLVPALLEETLKLKGKGAAEVAKHILGKDAGC